MVTCWKKADLLALVGDVMFIVFVTFPCGILGQVWYLIVSFPDLCLLSYFGMGFDLLSIPPFGSTHDYKELEVHKNDIRKDYAKCIENYKTNFMEIYVITCGPLH